jgi:hypothetical protein
LEVLLEVDVLLLNVVEERVVVVYSVRDATAEDTQRRNTKDEKEP